MKYLGFLVLLAACAPEDPEFRCTTDEACGDGRCEADGFCSFEDAACEGGRRFSEHSGALADQCLRFASKCRISGAAELIWELPIPDDARYVTQDDVPYERDGRRDFTGAFRRVGYCLSLDDQHAYVELDDFTGGVIDEIGLPTESIHDVDVTNVLVRSNVAASADGATGNLEMWPHCYGKGDDGRYDTRDDVDSETDCYGSFQIHRGDETVISYNHWAGGDPATDDLGIGNAPQNEPDWTFAETASSYRDRLLQAFVIR